MPYDITDNVVKSYYDSLHTLPLFTWLAIPHISSFNPDHTKRSLLEIFIIKSYVTTVCAILLYIVASTCSPMKHLNWLQGAVFH